ncbi:MAG: TlpA disulfide reductase family protein [Acidobacteriota bacterium]|nr:TlpA disulfide reductase family protein [Acidobacteriota bacterium]
MLKVLPLLALLAAPSAFAQVASNPAPFTGHWQAELTAARPGASESYQVPFVIEIEAASDGGITAQLVNGSDRMTFTTAKLHSGTEVSLRLEQYDSTLTAHCTEGMRICTRMEGEYTRQKGASAVHYAVAVRRLRKAEAAPPATLAADWQFQFSSPDGTPVHEASAPAHFKVNGDTVEGTIAPISGDYGLMAGRLTNGELHLSRFDGIHLLRLDGHLTASGQMEGVLHESPGAALNFKATAAGAASGFAEAESITTVADPSESFRFQGLDASGATVNQNDARFRGKVVFIDLFGTWCPNCHDEAPVLQSLYEKYRVKGFEVVGLSYEYVDDRARNQRLLDVYRKKYGIGFTLLLAGTTGEGEIARTLPQLRDFGAYPTGIFLDRKGRVRLIHAGFSGPATGRLPELRQHFEETIERLLDEP